MKWYMSGKGLIRRLRKPLSEMHGPHWPSPEDDVIQAYRSADIHEQHAIAAAVVEALRIIRSGMRLPNNVHALRALSCFVDTCDVRAAYQEILAIAECGAFGGKVGGIDEGVEPVVLSALAQVQPHQTLYERWLELWRRDVPRLWPVTTAGLRFADDLRAPEILPLAMARAESHPDFPLGEVLWAFMTSLLSLTGAAQARDAIRALPLARRAQARAALVQVGASHAQLARWGLGARPT